MDAEAQIASVETTQTRSEDIRPGPEHDDR
jgi:hypothetical protein